MRLYPSWTESLRDRFLNHKPIHGIVSRPLAASLFEPIVAVYLRIFPAGRAPRTAK
ncbi:hypothetical protein RMSM_01748 [Rhodopirellula maiorica SM1]|uniref:Uncharacterized protein n=1 Tax=Rhodopirellula maiorica SM1 TaxID=1265738 RepID=M5RPX2_9BACT|nr:hypothetical protein RMSM_01748 [Rhodopirellula maiorica SM1]